MRYVAAVSYDGTEYAGWQRQKNAVSVQETLEDALFTAFKKKIAVTASGRTDAGVHAEEQIVHFDADLTLPPEKLPEAVNKFLPADVSLLRSARAEDGFDANRRAKKKTYRYSTYVYPQNLPLKERFSVRLSNAPALEKLCECAALLCGKHDFKAFCAANSSVKTTVRTVYEIRVEERRFTAARGEGREIDFYVTGNGFLYNMVRTATGEILALASGKRTKESLLSAFETGRRELLDKT
ncbi:MAG: tRNA pseudouridine(38-40) synthase TruA, partial [Candidatus Scatosoma sp.]